MVNHEVGQHQRSRAAYPNCTVDQHPGWTRGRKTDCGTSGSKQNMFLNDSKGFYLHLHLAPSECNQLRGRNSRRGQRMANHAPALRSNRRLSRRSHNSPDCAHRHELRSQCEWFPASTGCSGRWPLTCEQEARKKGLGRFHFTAGNTGNIKDLHVTNEEVGPHFVHMITKPFPSVQDRHQVFNTLRGSGRQKAVLLFVHIQVSGHLKLVTSQNRANKLATCRICFSLLCASRLHHGQGGWQLILDVKLNQWPTFKKQKRI